MQKMHTVCVFDSKKYNCNSMVINGTGHILYDEFMLRNIVVMIAIGMFSW